MLKPKKRVEPEDELDPVEKIRLKPRKPWQDVKQKIATKKRRKKKKNRHV
jgi:hypothetical protein